MRRSPITTRAPFPYYGGKGAVAAEVWERFGNVANFVDPFCGSLAVLLARPHEPGIETVNDKHAMLCNFWRAVQHDPDAVAQWADWPVNECVPAGTMIATPTGEVPVERIRPGMMVWGERDGRVVPTVVEATKQSAARDFYAIDGLHLTGNRPVCRGRGINKGRINDRHAFILDWMRTLCDRLRDVRVCCGDWTRVLGPSPTWQNGLTAVFLDPPYAHAERDDELYAVDEDVSQAVRDWAVANGAHPLLRIALCSYGEQPVPDGWERFTWVAQGGYGNHGNGRGRANAQREVIDFSPHCLATPSQQLRFQIDI